MAFPGDLNTVQVTGTFTDPAGTPLRGCVYFTPSVFLTDPTDSLVIGTVTRQYILSQGTFSATLLATDNENVGPSGWGYSISVELADAQPFQYVTFIPHSPSPVDISQLVPAENVATMAQYMPTAGGTFTGPVFAPTPTTSSEVATLGYVQSVSAGLQAKPTVQEATAAALPANTYNGTAQTLTANFTGALTVDSVAVALGDRILVKNEVAGASNGVYAVTTLGTSMEPYVLTRAPDMDLGTDVPGALVAVEQGTQAGTAWLVEGAGPYTLGTTAIAWTPLLAPMTAGTGISVTGNTVGLSVPVAVSSGGSGSQTAPGSPAYAAKASAAETVIYVSKASYASDSNDGLSIGSAKATIAGALSALGTTGSGASLQNNTGLIQLGAGTWTDNTTHAIQGCTGMTIAGAGRNLTFIEGPDAAAWIQLTGCVDFKLKDLSYTGSPSATGWGLESINSWTGSQWTGTLDATRNGAENVVFGRANSTSPSCAYAVKFTIPNAASDANNDEGYFRNCMFWNCTTAVYVGHSESVQHTFDSCRFWSCGAGIQFNGGSASVINPVVVGLISGGSGYFLDFQAAYGSWESGVADYWHATTVTGGQAETAMNWINSAAGVIGGAAGRTVTVQFSGGDWDAGAGTYVNWQTSSASVVTFDSCKLGSTYSGTDNITVANAATSLVLVNCMLDQVPIINWAGTLRGLDTCTIVGTPPVLNGGQLAGYSFSPLNFGAAGNGTTNDTTAVQACAAVAAAVAGTVDLGTHTFLTSSPISVTGNFHMKGAGYNGGTITNSTSDLFTVSGSVSWVTFEGCTFTSASGGGHIWNAGTASMSFWKILGCVLTQDNPAKSIWHQTGGSWIDCLVDQQCFMSCATFATVSPWSITGVAGNVNSVKFSRARILANSAPVPFFLIDAGSAAGWNEEVVFDHITFELTTGGAIAMTACVDVGIAMCSLWDIPGARTDTGCTVTSGSASVTDASAGSGDVGKAINGSGIPAGTVITAVSGSTVTMSQNATANGTSVIVGGPAANQYSFTQSTGGYPCRDIQVHGGRANANTASAGTGYADLYADTHATNVLIDSFGGWGLPPVISSPATQTTIVNPVVSGYTVPVVSTVPGLSVSGLTGATTATRWVGATGGGAPVSGTFAAGDFVTDTVNGTFWVCTAAGTPGTWVTPASPPWEVQPSDIGIVAWTANPAKNPVTVKPAAGFAGVLLMWLFRVPSAGTISKINYSVDVIGATMANAFLGIYSAGSSATLLASCSTDQSTNMTTAGGAYAATLSSPLAVTAGLYRVGLVIGSATTMPTLMAAGGANSASFTNMGITSTANFMSVSTGTGNTGLPAGPISSGSFAAANAGLPVFVFN